MCRQSRFSFGEWSSTFGCMMAKYPEMKFGLSPDEESLFSIAENPMPASASSSLLEEGK